MLDHDEQFFKFRRDFNDRRENDDERSLILSLLNLMRHGL